MISQDSGIVERSPFEDILGGIGVVVSVEIARRRISLAELIALGPGVVLGLEAAPSTSVALLIDGTPFARGELVDVEGALGVRVRAIGGRS